jgi:hypothetical protein
MNFAIKSLIGFVLVLGSVGLASADMNPARINHEWQGCGKTNYVYYWGWTGKKKKVAAHSYAKRKMRLAAKRRCKSKCGRTKTARDFTRVNKGSFGVCSRASIGDGLHVTKYKCISDAKKKKFAYECR